MGLLNKQICRCTQWASRIKVLAKAKEGTHRNTLKSLNDEAYRLIYKDFDRTNPDMCSIMERLMQHNDGHPRHIVDLLKLAGIYQKLLDTAKKETATAYKETKSKIYEDDKFHTKAYRFLSSKQTAPICFLRRVACGPNNEPPGTFATQSSEIDGILKQAWGKIYDGNATSLEDVADRFLCKYQHLLYTAPETNVEPIDPQLFMDSCLRASNSAGGLDGWDPVDFKLLPLEAYQLVTDLLNAIEDGAAWPSGMVVGRMVFLAKDPKQAEEPLAYRPLLILPHIYRRWAAYRLGSLEGWIAGWSTDAMFAGVPEQGAEDAWWMTSVKMECWHATSTPFSGSSADIAKCFDQIVRPLLYGIAHIAGMPRNVLGPYMRFAEATMVHNTIGKGLGTAYSRRCGIPQGCPLSMMCIALILRPWTIAMDTMGAQPRILADDLLILTSGLHHCQLMKNAIDTTHEMLYDMAAIVAPAKSFIFSNSPDARRWYPTTFGSIRNARYRLSGIAGILGELSTPLLSSRAMCLMIVLGGPRDPQTIQIPAT